MLGAVICFAIAVIAISVIIDTALSSGASRRSRSDESWHAGKADDLSKNRKGERGRAELRLSTYLFYDEKQARRLVDGVQARHPDMSREWCAEKALSDLERDRQTR